MVISFAESALRDLEEVQARYAEQGVHDVGARLVEEVFQRVQALADHPDMGRAVPEFDQLFLRELIHPPFRIVCRRDPQRVRVVRVWRSERLLRLTSWQRQRQAACAGQGLVNCRGLFGVQDRMQAFRYGVRCVKTRLLLSA